MAGFFNEDTIEKIKPKEHTRPQCGRCGLKKSSTSGPLQPSGKGRKDILIIGKSPSKKEDAQGRLLNGTGTTILKYELEKHGINLKKDCIKINAVACCTKKQDVTDVHVDSCRPKVIEAINKYKPKLILVAGIDGLHSLISKRVETVGAFNKWRGYCIPDRKLNAWVCPVYHPNFILNDKTDAAEMIFAQDIDKALYHLKKPVPVYPDESKNVNILESISDIRRYLELLVKNPPRLAALDWECTGLKPDHPNHKIVSCSITHTPGYATAFLVTNRIRKRLCEFLTCKKIKKIAANLKFEERWSRAKLGVPIAGWIWDTMIAEHVLDNRQGITGLKFQGYVHYGLDNYDGHLSHLLKSTDDDIGKNGFNRIHEIPETELLIYNGIDTILEYRRAIDQMLLFGIIDPLYYAKHYRGI